MDRAERSFVRIVRRVECIICGLHPTVCVKKPVRFAVYFLPDPDDPLYIYGTEWLGWDVYRGRPMRRPDFGLDGRIVDGLTVEPRRYGFHGTVRPPMRIAGGYGLNDIVLACDNIAQACPRFAIPSLKLGAVGGCIAMVPDRECVEMARMSRLFVAGLDDSRPRLSEEELAARRAAGLTGDEERMLVKWGYPYVDATFRLHMTLTSRLEEADRAMAEERLAWIMEPVLGRPLECRAVMLVGEGGDGMFRFLHRFPLRG